MTPELKEAVKQITATLPGWCPFDKALFLADLVAASKPGFVLELGIYGGRSLLPMAVAAKMTGSKVIGVDPWTAAAALQGENAPENDKWWQEVDLDAVQAAYDRAIEQYGVSDLVTTYRTDSKEALPQIAAQLEAADARLDIIHQDGNHSQMVSTWEIENYEPLLAPGGYWILDDIGWDTNRAAYEMLKAKWQLIYEKPGEWACFRRGTE